MVKKLYSCLRCGKEFSQKSHYDSHNKRKTPCENIMDKVKVLVDKAVEEKLKELKNENTNTEIEGSKGMNDDNDTTPKEKLKVASMFAGCGGLDFAFHKLKNNFKVIYANDIDKDSCKTYENFYKLKNVCEDITKIENIPDCDVLTGGFPCFVAGTKVLTEHGYESIEEVTLDKKLMTHTGKCQRILNLQRKNYHGDLYNINVKYHSETICCTDEHPFYTREKVRKWNNKLRRYDYNFENPKWKKASELDHNHYFGMKVNENSNIPEFYFDKVINQHKTDTVRIKLDNIDMWFMMGYFVGDGWIEETKKSDGRDMNKIRFAINTKDQEYVVRRIKNILPITDKKCPSGKKCNKYGCSDFIWFNILKKFGKYAHGKMIPEWVQDAPSEYVRQFINGYLTADGSVNQQNNKYRITTVSYNLAYGVQRLFLKLGYIFGVSKDCRPKTCVIDGRTVNQRDTYVIGGYCRDLERNSLAFIEGGYVWYAPFKIEKFKVENEPVYNFEVENDNSYIIENIICHNCQDFSVANPYRKEDTSRNKLYKELVRLLQLKKPKYFIFENVKGILSIGGYENNIDKKNHKGKVFKMILDDLEKCGYQVHTKLFKMKWYDIPQNRERVIFIGIRNDIAKNIKFEWPKETQKITKTLKDAIGDLPIKYNEKNQHIGTKHKVKVTGYIGNRELDWDDISPTITGRGGGTGGPVINIHPSGERRMTVREYARIQTFPDNFKFSGSISSMYRQIGNAVPPKFSYTLANIISDIDKQI